MRYRGAPVELGATALPPTMLRGPVPSPSPTGQERPSEDAPSAEMPADAVTSVQLAREGKWQHPKYGEFEFNRAVFDQMIHHFNARVPDVDLPFDVEHHPEWGAVAWFVPGTMRIETTDKGVGLFVNVKWTPKGHQLARSEEYKYTSLTYWPEWTDPETQKKHKYVVFGAAFTTVPYIKGMPPVQTGFVNLSDDEDDDFEDEEEAEDGGELSEFVELESPDDPAMDDDEIVDVSVGRRGAAVVQRSAAPAAVYSAVGAALAGARGGYSAPVHGVPVESRFDAAVSPSELTASSNYRTKFQQMSAKSIALQQKVTGNFPENDSAAGATAHPSKEVGRRGVKPEVQNLARYSRGSEGGQSMKCTCGGKGKCAACKEAEAMEMGQDSPMCSHGRMLGSCAKCQRHAADTTVEDMRTDNFIGSQRSQRKKKKVMLKKAHPKHDGHEDGDEEEFEMGHTPGVADESLPVLKKFGKDAKKMPERALAEIVSYFKDKLVSATSTKLSDESDEDVLDDEEGDEIEEADLEEGGEDSAMVLAQAIADYQELGESIIERTSEEVTLSDDEEAELESDVADFNELSDALFEYFELLEESNREEPEEENSPISGELASEQFQPTGRELSEPVVRPLYQKGEAHMNSRSMTDNTAHEINTLSERLAEVEAQRARDAAELSELREEKRRGDMVRLSANWFPRANSTGFRIKSTDRDRVVDFMLKLSMIDEATNDHIRTLSESDPDGAYAVDSNLLGDFQAILNAVPEVHSINTRQRSLSEGDSEAELLSDDERQVLAVRKLAEEQKIPFHEAAMRLAVRRI